MRLALPVDDDRRLAVHTGRAAGFLVYEIDNGRATELEFRPHSSPHHQHGAGHGPQHGSGGGKGHGGHGHGGLLDMLGDIDRIIALGAGPRLQADFAARNIELQFTRERDPAVVAAQVAAGSFTTHPKGSLCKGGQHTST